MLARVVTSAARVAILDAGLVSVPPRGCHKVVRSGPSQCPLGNVEHEALAQAFVVGQKVQTGPELDAQLLRVAGAFE